MKEKLKQSKCTITGNKYNPKILCISLLSGIDIFPNHCELICVHKLDVSFSSCPHWDAGSPMSVLLSPGLSGTPCALITDSWKTISALGAHYKKEEKQFLGLSAYKEGKLLVNTQKTFFRGATHGWLLERERTEWNPGKLGRDLLWLSVGRWLSWWLCVFNACAEQKTWLKLDRDFRSIQKHTIIGLPSEG